MTSPKVSVIVPVYNVEEWLPGSFCSFEEQSYSNIEWVLVDDGSTDEPAGLCAEWCSADIARRRFVRVLAGALSSLRREAEIRGGIRMLMQGLWQSLLRGGKILPNTALRSRTGSCAF